MNGKKQKIKDIIPVTTTKAVYIDGTNKTLQETIDRSPEGITLYNNEIYVGHTTNYLYKFNLLNLT